MKRASEIMERRKGGRKNNAPEDTVALLYVRHSLPDRFNDTSCRLSKDSRVFDEETVVSTCEREKASVSGNGEGKKAGRNALNLEVDGVDRDGVNLQSTLVSRLRREEEEKRRTLTKTSPSSG